MTRRLHIEQMEARAMLSGLSVVNSQYWHQDLQIDDIAENLDQFGWAVAAGDFNGDDFQDLAVGVPGEAVGDGPGAGAVNVIYGSRNRLVADESQLWDQATLTGRAQSNAFVGATLATGDFNGDGVDDLAVGIPNADIEGRNQAGGVALLYGVRNGGLGTASQQYWHQNVEDLKGVSNSMDHFGASLAAADFNGDGIDDLAIGVPNDEINDKREAGGVAVIYGSRSNGLTTAGDQYWHQDIESSSGNVRGDAEAGDHFGMSLATGDFDGDGASDLAIGVPDDEINDQERAGGVAIVYGSRGLGLTATNNQFWHQDVEGVEDVAEEGDGFGAAVAAGNFDGDGFDDLAVGIPGENLNGAEDAGAVQILAGSARGLETMANQLWHQDRPGIAETAESNDRFGAAIASGDFRVNDDIDELIVGAPGEALNGASGVGVVIMLSGTREGLVAGDSQTWRPSDLGLVEHRNEQFGHSLSVGDFDQNRFLDLAIGIPLDTAVSAVSGAVAVMYGSSDTDSPLVTINQAPDQVDPTSDTSIRFVVEFSEPVTGFSESDVSVTGTAGATAVSLQGSGAVYLVTVSGMERFGTVTATIPAGVAADRDGNTNLASVSTDNTVSYQEAAQVAVVINQADAQTDPSTSAEILFEVEFSEPVSGFTAADVQLAGTAGAANVAVRGSGSLYEVRVSGMQQAGTVIATIPADVVLPPNAASTSVDNIVSFQPSPLTVTINQALGQDDPTRDPIIRFDVQFSQPVVGFTEAEVNVSGTSLPMTTVVTGSGANYTVAVGGMAGSGDIIAFIPAGVVVDSEGNPNQRSMSTDSVVNYLAPPRVTINQAQDQADPTSGPPIKYRVRFSEPVTGFTQEDVVVSGTAGADQISVSGAGAIYEVQVSGMKQSGTVTAHIPAGVVSPSNAASTSTDNTISFELDPAAPVGWTNVADPLDVTNDGNVSPLDVLRIIIEINSPQFSDGVGRLNAIDTAPPNPPGYLDVTGDGFVSPRDALLIISHINSSFAALAAALAEGSDEEKDEFELVEGSEFGSPTLIEDVSQQGDPELDVNRMDQVNHGHNAPR